MLDRGPAIVRSAPGVVLVEVVDPVAVAVGLRAADRDDGSLGPGTRLGGGATASSRTGKTESLLDGSTTGSVGAPTLALAGAAVVGTGGVERLRGKRCAALRPRVATCDECDL
jgi:hypothetical protein